MFASSSCLLWTSASIGFSFRGCSKMFKSLTLLKSSMDIPYQGMFARTYLFQTKFRGINCLDIQTPPAECSWTLQTYRLKHPKNMFWVFGCFLHPISCRLPKIKGSWAQYFVMRLVSCREAQMTCFHQKQEADVAMVGGGGCVRRGEDMEVPSEGSSCLRVFNIDKGV